MALCTKDHRVLMTTDLPIYLFISSCGWHLLYQVNLPDFTSRGKSDLFLKANHFQNLNENMEKSFWTVFLRGSAYETLLCGNAKKGRKVEIMPSKGFSWTISSRKTFQIAFFTWKSKKVRGSIYWIIDFDLVRFKILSVRFSFSFYFIFIK